MSMYTTHGKQISPWSKIVRYSRELALPALLITLDLCCFKAVERLDALSGDSCCLGPGMLTLEHKKYLFFVI